MKTVEELLIDSIWDLLLGGVNDYLSDIDTDIPRFERGDVGVLGGIGKVPKIEAASCAREEKERILKCDVYVIKISFSGSEQNCYRYSRAINEALVDNPSLGGIAARVVFASKSY